MELLRLHFPAGDQADVDLAPGIHGLARGTQADRLRVVARGQPAMAWIRLDRTGVWLEVGEGERGVHLNGRSLHAMAVLRPGDSLYLDGIEVRLLCGRSRALDAGHAERRSRDADAGDPRAVLRGIGGVRHGQAFSLEKPVVVGSGAAADIHLEADDLPQRHAQLLFSGGRVLLRHLQPGGVSLVNGEPVSDALLLPGDQVVFHSSHRFVLEAPVGDSDWRPGVLAPIGLDPPLLDDDAAGADAQAGRRRPRLPMSWLLLMAALIAGLLSLLLLFGAP